jgi:tryptophan synthase alpha chain
MPYLMGGFPDQATATAVAEAYADAGADLIELGVPSPIRSPTDP